MPTITVLTPAYNRAHTLGRLRESLLAQTFSDFEWVIVDDGSEDDIEALASSWIAENTLEIRYRKQPNQGQHVAVNRGVELARGEFTTVVDDDDWLVENALERLLYHWTCLPASERHDFSGIVGLCASENGDVIGDRFPSDPLDCDFVELTHIYGISGDKHGMHRTDVCREFPFPFEDVRGWVTQALVVNRVALKYRARHVNEVMVIKEYRDEGMTARALELLIRAAPATRQYYLEEAALPHPLPFRLRLRSYANYVRFSLHVGIRMVDQASAVPSKAAWLAVTPLGFALYRRDRRRFPALRPPRGR